MADILFKVHRSQILPAINAVYDAVDSKAKIPILANILLNPQGEHLFVRGTDLSIEIEAECELMEESNASPITLDGARLRDVLRNLPESAEIEFQAGPMDGQIRMRAGRASFLIFSLPERDFPSIAQHVTGKPFTVDVKSLSTALGKVLYAVENSSSDRIYLTGIFIHPYEGGDKIAVVATNGHCMAVVRVPTKDRADFRPVILPVKAATAIRKHLGEGKAEAQIRISESLLQIESDGTSIITNLIDAVFPDYMRVVPTGNNTVMRGTIDTLSDAARRVCLVAGDVSKDAMVMVLEENSLRIKMSARDGEEADDEIGVEFGGDKFTIAFNGSLFEKTLATIVTSDVDVFFADASTAAIFKPTALLDEFFILSPMRIN